MTDKKEPNYALIVTVVTAVVGLIGTILTLYFNYLQTRVPFDMAATERAEARIERMTLTAEARLLITPTETFAPTFTATSTNTLLPPTATATPTITLTATPATPTVTPGGMPFCINTESIYVRAGPGTGFSVIGGLNYGKCLFFDARSEDLLWLRIAPGQADFDTLGEGWVRSDLVRPQDFEQLPTIILTPTPTSTRTPEG
jgi:hypothetical protein